jgi:hypothetical protein
MRVLYAQRRQALPGVSDGCSGRTKRIKQAFVVTRKLACLPAHSARFVACWQRNALRTVTLNGIRTCFCLECHSSLSLYLFISLFLYFFIFLYFYIFTI